MALAELDEDTLYGCGACGEAVAARHDAERQEWVFSHAGAEERVSDILLAESPWPVSTSLFYAAHEVVRKAHGDPARVRHAAGPR